MRGDDEPNKKTVSVEFRQRSSDHLANGSRILDAGIVWERLSIGYRIMDLRENRFDEALELVKEQFFNTEPMCRATNLSKDKTSVVTYLEMITSWMKEMLSMYAIHEGTGKLVGVAVATLNTKADQSKDASRIRTSQGEAIFKIQTLKSCVFGNAGLYDKYQIAQYFRLHVLCVDVEHQSKGIGTALARSCIDFSRRLRLPACIGAFSSGAGQTVAERLSFDNLAEIPYGEYATPGKNEKPFVDVGPGNYSVACMGLRVLVLEDLSRTVSVTNSTTSSSKKKTKKTMKGT